VPARELPAEALDTDTPRVGVLSPTSAAEADELAQVETRAEAARARAIWLRQQAEMADQGDVAGMQEIDAERDAEVAYGAGKSESAPSRRWRLRRLGRKASIATAAVVVSCASLTVSGYLAWHHHNVVEQRQRAAEFSQVARNAILTMLSIDASKARDTIQRFADDTTGLFKASVLMGAEDLVKVIEQSKISTKSAVRAVAVESMTNDSAVVLVSAKSEFTRPGQAKPESRSLRAVVNVQRDGGQLKISRVEFVP